MIVTEPQRMRN